MRNYNKKPNAVAEFQFSLVFIQLLNFAYFVFYSIESFALFHSLLPNILTGKLRDIASISIGLVLGAALITGTIYSEKKQGLNRWVFAFISLFLTLKFFGVFSNPDYTLILLSILLVIIEVNNAKIFFLKYTELKSDFDSYSELDELSKKFQELQRNYKTVQKELIETKLNHRKFSCRHCETPLGSISSKKKHEAKCLENPKNQILKNAT